MRPRVSDKEIRTPPRVRGAPRRPISADKPRRGVLCNGLSSRRASTDSVFWGENRCNRTFGGIALAVGVLAAPGIEPSGKDRLKECEAIANPVHRPQAVANFCRARPVGVVAPLRAPVRAERA